MSNLVVIKSDIIYPIGPNMNRNMGHIKSMSRALKRFVNQRSVTMWVGGSSGAIIGGILSSRLDSECIINYVYKNNENSHFTNDIDRVLTDSLNIIVDDFVVSGSTIIRILNRMARSRVNPDCLCIGGACTAKALGKFPILPEVIIAREIMHRVFVYDDNGVYDHTDDVSITKSGKYDLVKYLNKYKLVL